METTTGAPGETPSTTARRRLVVIIGPIAAGKSTLASELAGLMRGGGQAVAVVGLDTVAEMALPTLDDWTWAHDIHGQIVAAWLATPIATVIAEGPETPAEVDLLMRHVPSDVSVFRVLLVARYETARQRTSADPSRGISRDPDFLATMYRRFTDELPGLTYDLHLRSEDASAGALAARVIAAIAGA